MSKKDDDTESLSYKGSGVDIDAGTELVRRIAKMAPGIGGFGGLFPLGTQHKKLQTFTLLRMFIKFSFLWFGSEQVTLIS